MDFHQAFINLPSIRGILKKNYDLVPWENDWLIGIEVIEEKTFVILQSPNIDIYDAIRYAHKFAEDTDKSNSKGYFSQNQHSPSRIKLLHPKLISETIITANTNCKVLYDKLY